MTNTPAPYNATGPDATTTGGNGFTTRGFLSGPNYGNAPSAKVLKSAPAPRYPQKAVPAYAPVKKALGLLPPIFKLYHSN